MRRLPRASRGHGGTAATRLRRRHQRRTSGPRAGARDRPRRHGARPPARGTGRHRPEADAAKPASDPFHCRLSTPPINEDVGGPGRSAAGHIRRWLGTASARAVAPRTAVRSIKAECPRRRALPQCRITAGAIIRCRVAGSCRVPGGTSPTTTPTRLPPENPSTLHRRGKGPCGNPSSTTGSTQCRVLPRLYWQGGDAGHAASSFAPPPTGIVDSLRHRSPAHLRGHDREGVSETIAELIAIRSGPAADRGLGVPAHDGGCPLRSASSCSPGSRVGCRSRCR